MSLFQTVCHIITLSSLLNIISHNCSFWWKPYNTSVRNLLLAQGTYYKFLTTLHQCAPDDGWHFTITCQGSGDAKLFWCCYLIFLKCGGRNRASCWKCQLRIILHTTREMKKIGTWIRKKRRNKKRRKKKSKKEYCLQLSDLFNAGEKLWWGDVTVTSDKRRQWLTCKGLKHVLLTKNTLCLIEYVMSALCYNKYCLFKVLGI